MNNLQDQGWDLDDLKYIEVTGQELELYQLEPGDILFNRTNSKELVGKCEVFREPGIWVFASYLIRLRVDVGRALPDFVTAYLSTRAGRAQIDRVSRQIIGMSNINAEEIRDLVVPLPTDLGVQQALVDELDAAKRSRDKQLREAALLLNNLDGVFQRALALPAEEHAYRLAFGVHLRGLTPARLDPHFYQPRFRHLVSTLVDRGSIHLGRIIAFSDERWDRKAVSGQTFHYLEIGAVDLQSGEVHPTELAVVDAPSRAQMLTRAGDVIVSLTRPHHGAIAIIDDNLSGCVASTGFAVLRGLLREDVSLDYLWCALKSDFCLGQMLQRSSGGSYPAITEQELTNILVPVPSTQVQQGIVAEVTRQIEEAKRLRSEAYSAWESARDRFQARLFEESHTS